MVFEKNNMRVLRIEKKCNEEILRRVILQTKDDYQN